MTPNIEMESKEKLSRAESSRINGAQSKGPVSIEGKLRSCLNRTTHGMYSSRVVLHNECQATYNDLSARFFCLFSPKDIFEYELVTNMVNSRWYVRRLEAATSANVDIAMEEARIEFEQKYANINATHEHALAYRAIAQSSGNSDIMGRHEDRQHRIFERSYRLLAKHRGRSGAIPTNEDLLRAESALPPDNLPPEPEHVSQAVHNPLNSEPITQNEALEPETPPQCTVDNPVPLENTSKDDPHQAAHIPLNPEPVTQNEALEPEIPPQCTVDNPVPVGKTHEDDPNQAVTLTDKEYQIMKPLYDSFDQHPELRHTIAKTIREFRDRYGFGRAA